MRVADKHVRLIPEGNLAAQLQEGILEDVISDDIPPTHCSNEKNL